MYEYASRENSTSEIVAFMRACNTDTFDNRSNVNHSDRDVYDFP